MTVQGDDGKEQKINVVELRSGECFGYSDLLKIVVSFFARIY